VVKNCLLCRGHPVLFTNFTDPVTLRDHSGGRVGAVHVEAPVTGVAEEHIPFVSLLHTVETFLTVGALPRIRSHLANLDLIKASTLKVDYEVGINGYFRKGKRKPQKKRTLAEASGAFRNG